MVAHLISVKCYLLQGKKVTRFSEIYLYICVCCDLNSSLIVFYSGPNRGHYIAIVKSHDFWLLFDDDIVEVSFWVTLDFFHILIRALARLFAARWHRRHYHANAHSKWERTVSAELHFTIWLYNNLNCFNFYNFFIASVFHLHLLSCSFGQSMWQIEHRWTDFTIMRVYNFLAQDVYS